MDKMPSTVLATLHYNALSMYSVIHISIPPIKELCSKMAPGEVGVSLPWWCHTLVLPPPGYWGLFLNLIIFSKWKNGQFQRNFMSKLKVLNFSNFTLWNFTVQLLPKSPLKLGIFPFWKNFEKKKSSAPWSWKGKGVASSWKWHASFS